MRLLILSLLLSGCACRPYIPDIKDLYLDTCAEGDISEDPLEAHEQGYDCAIEVLKAQLK